MKSDNIINHDKITNVLLNEPIEVIERQEKVVLVGNPNVGKSCIFNYMSGMYVDVSNFPGTTISITKSS